MKRERLPVIYVKNSVKIKEIDELKLCKEKFKDFYIREALIAKSSISENDSSSLSIDVDELCKNIKKPIFKGDVKTYPNFKNVNQRPKKKTGFRASLMNTFGFGSKEEKTDSKINDYHPIYFNSKARIIENFSESKINNIENPLTPMGIEDFLAQFSIEEEVIKLDINQLLDIDNKKLKELMKQAEEFIDATSYLITEKEKNGQDVNTEDALLQFYVEKLNELKENEIQMQVCLQNLDKVEGIQYEKDGAKLFFKKKT